MKSGHDKQALYWQVARLGKALSSPKRLELLELLSQGEKPVEQLAKEAGIDFKLASAHLRALRAACMVATRKAGKQVVYRVSGEDVEALWIRLREVAGTYLVEFRHAFEAMSAERTGLPTIDRQSLLQRIQRDEVLVIDVRPYEEYAWGHLPRARSIPVTELVHRLDELPIESDIVAYCRGPFCRWSDVACQYLRDRGYQAMKFDDGVCEWRAAGLPLASN